MFVTEFVNTKKFSCFYTKNRKKNVVGNEEYFEETVKGRDCESRYFKTFYILFQEIKTLKKYKKTYVNHSAFTQLLFSTSRGMLLSDVTPERNCSEFSC